MSALAVLGAAMLLVSGAGALPAHAATAEFSSVPLASWRLDGVGYATLVMGNVVYVGGDFDNATSPDGSTVVPRHGLAAFDLRTGGLIGSFRADTDGPVRALATDGSTLYVGGSFGSVNGSSTSRLAALDPDTGAVRSGWKAYVYSNVYGLSVAAGNLYVAGSFNKFDGVAREKVAAVRLSDASLTSFAPTVNATVLSVAASVDGTAVYIGGPYTSVNGQPAANLARLSTDGDLVSVPWQGVDGPALALTLSDDGTRLGAGLGGQPTAGHTGVNQSAWFDTSSGAKLWRQVCDGDAQAVQLVDGSLFTGFHEGCNGDGTTRVVNNDLSGHRDTTFTPTFDQYWGVRAIAGSSAGLAVAGDFTNVSGIRSGAFAIFPPTSAPPPPEDPAPGSFTETWSGSDGDPWPVEWTASAGSAGTTNVMAGRGMFNLPDGGAWGRATLNALGPADDSDVLMSYQWSSTASTAYLTVYLRGSGTWQNKYRPENGYSVQLSSRSKTVQVKQNVNGQLSRLASVSGAQRVTTQRQWLRARVEDGALKFRTWLDGTTEPSGWTATVPLPAALPPGSLYLSGNLSGSATAGNGIGLDDLTVTTGTLP